MKPLIKFTVYIFLVRVLLFISCKKEYSCEGCINGNKPPIAVAGPDQMITLPTDSISLDGSLSSDPDGTISGYLWTKISGPASFNINNVAAVKTIVKNLAAGSYQFELKVKDNGGLSAKDTVQIIVNNPGPPNQPPVANAGADQTITLPNNTITLNGIGSTDPDNNITSYAWTKISGPSSFNIANANAVQTQVTNYVQGIYQFELKVTDGGGLFSKDTMQVTVNNPGSTNQQPVANAGANQVNSLTINNVNLDGSGSFDNDGIIVSSLWAKLSGPGQVVITDPNLLVTTVSGLSAGVYLFRLQVTDNMGAVDDDTLQIEMLNTLSGYEIIYNGGWGCNDLCRDGDVYWDSSQWPGNLYSNPNIPLQVSIRLDTSAVWIDVYKINSPLPPINQFYWVIDRGFLWVFAYEGRLIGTPVTVKVNFL